MKNSKHSPIPWTLSNGRRYVHSGDTEVAAVCAIFKDDSNHFDDEKMDANAALIIRASNNFYALLRALKAADSILWMAEKYAEAGGSGGQEMQDFNKANEIIQKALKCSH